MLRQNHHKLHCKYVKLYLREKKITIEAYLTFYYNSAHVYIFTNDERVNNYFSYTAKFKKGVIKKKSKKFKYINVSSSSSLNNDRFKIEEIIDKQSERLQKRLTNLLNLCSEINPID